MMRTKLPHLMIAGLVLGAMAGSHAQTPRAATLDGAPLTIEINGEKVVTDGTGGTITIRTDGDSIAIDADGDGEAEQHIAKAAVREMGWLGIKTSELSPELASQLDIGGGAVIEMVLPDSPAEKSGLHDYDIITAVGKTPTDTPEELSAAIRAILPGSAVGISVIRKAKPVELVATLGSRPAMPEAIDPAEPEIDIAPSGGTESIREQIEKLQNGILKGMELNLDDIDLPGLSNGNGANIVRESSHSKSTSFSDGDGSITITSKDGETRIEAMDAEGKLLYKGPAETEDDRKKLPAGVLEKLRRFEEMEIEMDKSAGSDSGSERPQ